MHLYKVGVLSIFLLHVIWLKTRMQKIKVLPSEYLSGTCNRISLDVSNMYSMAREW